MGDFIEKYIFPGGELLHVTHVLRETAARGPGDGRHREPAAALCAHALGLVGRARARLDEAREVLQRAGGRQGSNAERILRAYRLYLAGSAMSFEQGWISLHQMLATRPDGKVERRRIARRAIGVPFCPRLHLQISERGTMLYRFKSRAPARPS